MEFRQDDGKIMIVRNNDRPGDIFIPNWVYNSLRMGAVYMDVTIGNNFAPSNIKFAIKGIGGMANELESRKYRRYKKHDVLGLGLEIFGGQSPALKNVLHTIARKLGASSIINETQ
jgi:hypothetical protein